MNEERFCLLVEKYVEGSLSDDEARELLGAPGPLRARLLDEVTMAGLLARSEGRNPSNMAAKVQAGLRAASEKDAMVGAVMNCLPVDPFRKRGGPGILAAIAAVAVLCVAAFLLWPGKPAGPASIPPAAVLAPEPELTFEVKAAIARAVGFLRGAKLPSASHEKPAPAEDLVLWAFLHAGVPQDDPMVQSLLKTALAAQLQRTYTVSIQAMALQKLDPVTYRDRIADCAQFLVDNQCLNGQWSYGAATVPARPGGIVKKTRDGALSGNNSCSQFAAMALRACVDAGIAIPQETLERGARAWHESQRPQADGRIGWCYTRDESPHRPYGSMTAGGVASLVILNRLAGKDWHQDKSALAGLSWLVHHFTTLENFGPVEELMAKEMISDTPNPNTELYYWIWAAGRAATLCGLEKLGIQDWYAEGVHELLAAQKPDGSWSSGVIRCQPVWDTCYAILFLTKSTRPFKD
jgi:hypothetical protein